MMLKTTIISNLIIECIQEDNNMNLEVIIEERHPKHRTLAVGKGIINSTLQVDISLHLKGNNYYLKINSSKSYLQTNNVIKKKLLEKFIEEYEQLILYIIRHVSWLEGKTNMDYLESQRIGRRIGVFVA
jgi:hypothetical protein